MRILVVSWNFPPTNTMGALRVGKLCDYLLSQGHDVHVLSARGVPRHQSLDLDFPEDRVLLSGWLDVNAPVDAILRLLRRGGKNSGSGGGSPPRETQASSPAPGDGVRQDLGLRRRLSRLYTDAINFPDAYIGWLPFAVAAGWRLLRRQRFDLIFATEPPVTGLLVGYLLSKFSGVPWVAEFRDRWADDPYYAVTPWRQRLEAMAERRLVKSALALVTVSDPWAEAYREKYGKPVQVVYNGFDPADFPVPGRGAPDDDRLTIVYTGRIYPGRRDPTPLFEAVRLLRGKVGLRLIFYGAHESRIMPLAEACGVADVIEIHPLVPYREALAAQLEADVLLFMQWNDPREQGNVPGKLFEYLAAQRPILGLGLDDGVPATIIRERGAGFFCNNPEDIASQIEKWYQEKQRDKQVKTLPSAIREGFSREEQFHNLEKFLEAELQGRAGRDH